MTSMVERKTRFVEIEGRRPPGGDTIIDERIISASFAIFFYSG